MMTAPDPGAALGAKAVVAAGKNLSLFEAKLLAKSKNGSACGEIALRVILPYKKKLFGGGYLKPPKRNYQ